VWERERVSECWRESVSKSVLESESESGSGSVCQREGVCMCASSQALNSARGGTSGATCRGCESECKNV